MSLPIGSLLAASDELDYESPFHHAVVVIVDRVDGITQGLIVNRDTPVPAFQVNSAAVELVGEDDLAFWGGPVPGGAYIVEFVAREGLERLLTSSASDPASRRPWLAGRVGIVMPGEDFSRLAPRVERARLYAGCCAWKPGQLESQLVSGYWLTAAARPEDLFSDDPGLLWDEVSERAAPATYGMTLSDEFLSQLDEQFGTVTIQIDFEHPAGAPERPTVMLETPGADTLTRLELHPDMTLRLARTSLTHGARETRVDVSSLAGAQRWRVNIGWDPDELVVHVGDPARPSSMISAQG